MKRITVVTNAGPVRAMIDEGKRLLFDGDISTGQWMRIPMLARLKLTGTGTCTMDSRNSAGEITEGVEVYSVSSATGEIKFPYPGDDAEDVRFTLTGSCAVEIL